MHRVTEQKRSAARPHSLAMFRSIRLVFAFFSPNQTAIRNTQVMSACTITKALRTSVTRGRAEEGGKTCTCDDPRLARSLSTSHFSVHHSSRVSLQGWPRDRCVRVELHPSTGSVWILNDATSFLVLVPLEAILLGVCNSAAAAGPALKLLAS